MRPDMLQFHCCVHRAPNESTKNRQAQSVSIRGQKITTIRFEQPWEALPVTFEEAAERLESIAGLHFELDGWFIWGEGAGAGRWQVDGQLSDGGEHLEFVEMKGKCPAEALDQLLCAFGSEQAPLAIQLIQEGVFVDVVTLKRLAKVGRLD